MGPLDLPAGWGQGLGVHGEYKSKAAALVEIDCTPATVNRNARHDRPLHVHRAAAVAFVGGQAQVIDEYRERRQREVLGENDADAQRRA